MANPLSTLLVILVATVAVGGFGLGLAGYITGNNAWNSVNALKATLGVAAGTVYANGDLLIGSSATGKLVVNPLRVAGNITLTNGPGTILLTVPTIVQAPVVVNVTTLGGSTLYAPDGATGFRLTMMGGGGSGGGAGTDGGQVFGGGGGGGGGFFHDFYVDMTLDSGAELVLYVGSGGEAVSTASTNGNDGEATTLAYGDYVLSAWGGGGGMAGDATGCNGCGGAGAGSQSGGTLNITGSGTPNSNNGGVSNAPGGTGGTPSIQPDSQAAVALFYVPGSGGGCGKGNSVAQNGASSGLAVSYSGGKGGTGNLTACGGGGGGGASPVAPGGHGGGATFGPGQDALGCGAGGGGSPVGGEASGAGGPGFITIVFLFSDT